MQKISIFYNWIEYKDAGLPFNVPLPFSELQALLNKGAKVVSITQHTEVVWKHICLITTVVLELPDDK